MNAKNSTPKPATAPAVPQKRGPGRPPKVKDPNAPEVSPEVATKNLVTETITDLCLRIHDSPSRSASVRLARALRHITPEDARRAVETLRQVVEDCAGAVEAEIKRRASTPAEKAAVEAPRRFVLA